ncbi:hypothetical protein CFI10_15765 [Marinobacterium iners]|nr:hypothetical protein CFI10_15765 [Marinobacterium iners]
MGYKDVKALVLTCLQSGNILHASRGDIDTKNLLCTGQVTSEEVAEIIRRSRGSDYVCSPHHSVSGVDVHIIQRSHKGVAWYIKWYFVEPNSIFISVHH